MIKFPDRETMIRSFPSQSIVAEIGVWHGGFSKQIVEECAPRALYLVDLWAKQTGGYERDSINNDPLDQICEKVRVTFADYTNVKIIREWSHIAATLFPDKYFDWIYLDADHSYGAVTRDLDVWSPKIKEGGIFAGHDYYTGLDCPWIEVPQALNDWLRRHDVELSGLTTDIFASWYFFIR